MKILNIPVEKIKKFDFIELINGTHTVNYLRMCKGHPYVRIYYMNGRSTFCLKSEIIEVKRDNFYSLTHKKYDTNILNILQ